MRSQLQPPPRILLPSLGQPAIIEPGVDRFEAWLLATEPPGDHFRQGWSAIPVGEARSEPQPLRVLSIEELPRPAFETPLVHLLASSNPRWIRMELEAPSAHAPVSLFDLHHDDLPPARHAVAGLAHDPADLRVLYLADTHVAEMWDTLETLLEQADTEPIGAPGDPSAERLASLWAVRTAYLNANLVLCDMVERANRMARDGDLDLVIVGGDLVDYRYRRMRKESGAAWEDTNYALFCDLITGDDDRSPGLNVPMFTCTGNHDYRLHPYRLEVYGLKHCGLHEDQTLSLLDQTIGRGPRWPQRADLDCITAPRSKKNHSLVEYFLYINPCEDYVLQIGGTRLVFLDAGRDAFVNSLHINPLRWGNLGQTILFGGNDPDSECLLDHQVDFLEQAVEDRDYRTLLLMCHAGVFNTPLGFEVDPDRFAGEPQPFVAGTSEYEHALKILPHLERKDGLLTRVRYEIAQKLAGLNNGCCFQNQLALLREAVRPDHDFMCLGGHLHRNVEFRLDLASGTLLQADYARGGLDEPYERPTAWFLTPNSVGHAQPKFTIPNPPEYYTLRIDEDRIRHAQRFRVRFPPHHQLYAFARPTYDPACEMGFDVLLHLLDEALDLDTVEVTVTAVFEGQHAGRCSVSIDGAGQVLPPVDLDPAAARKLVGSDEPVRTCSIRMPWATETTVRVQSPDRKPAIRVIVEFVETVDGRAQPLRLNWHPHTLTLGE